MTETQFNNLSTEEIQEIQYLWDKVTSKIKYDYVNKEDWTKFALWLRETGGEK